MTTTALSGILVMDGQWRSSDIASARTNTKNEEDGLIDEDDEEEVSALVCLHDSFVYVLRSLFCAC